MLASSNKHSIHFREFQFCIAPLWDQKKDSPILDFYYYTAHISLIHGELYDIYVKTWYGPSKFAIFTSESIKIYLTPPNVRRGRYIIEGMDDCSTDLDFIYWTGQISACWSGVFSEQQSDIHHYLVALGASPNVDDVFKSENMGLKTNISIDNLTLETPYILVLVLHLEGSPMFVTRNEHLIHIDGEQAFDTLPEIPVVYSLVVGSREGFTDILDINYYTGNTYDIVASSSTLISPKITELFFTITCTYPTRMSSVYKTIFTL
ncbi:hypothetical protein MAR_034359 [Mya arenaria]|uniref:Uncharacterized protein n=1 Tax=Mya arenaria TaxID=6604 RepID=A0ABY7GD35_MYAAR|nr:hypothetical protein MAR_034359 [Mya arenaria]